MPLSRISLPYLPTMNRVRSSGPIRLPVERLKVVPHSRLSFSPSTALIFSKAARPRARPWPARLCDLVTVLLMVGMYHNHRPRLLSMEFHLGLRPALFVVIA